MNGMDPYAYRGSAQSAPLATSSGWSPGWATFLTWLVVVPVGLLVGLGLVAAVVGAVARHDPFLSVVGFFGLAAFVLGGPILVLGILYLRRRTRGLFIAFAIVLLLAVALAVHARLTDGMGVFGYLGLLWYITYMPDTTSMGVTASMVVAV